ncbi:hypothetical protein [Streptomyces sp. NPDC052496]|uniref:hypothetical protein n=1 Tax=Streptomyces sp. NPDC052496 TaxID=3154951 RepID=UPI00342B50AA
MTAGLRGAGLVLFQERGEQGNARHVNALQTVSIPLLTASSQHDVWLGIVGSEDQVLGAT